MPVEYISCNIEAVDELLSKRWESIPEDRQKEINRRTEDTLRRYQSVSALPAEQGLTSESRQYATEIFRRVMGTANMVSIAPNTQRGLAYHLAMSLGQEQAALGLADDIAKQALPRRILADIKRRGRGEVHQILNHISFIDESVNADRVLEKLRKRLNVPQQEWDRLKLDAYEIGMQPILQKDLAIIGPEGIAFMRGRQKRFFEALKRAGVDDDSARVLGEVTSGVVDKYRTTLEILNEFGVKLDEASDLLNYFPRSFSPAALQRFGWSKNPDSTFTFYGITGPAVKSESLPSVFTKSRNSFNYVVEDQVIMEEVLKAIDEQLFNISAPNGIASLIEDTGALSQAIKVFEKQQPDLFDALVDAGYLSKIPMTGSELFDYAVRRYQLPFKNLSEFMAVDFGRAATLYRNQAEKLVGRSFQANFTAKAAVEGGWGVTLGEKLLDPKTYDKYIQLTTPGNVDAVITKSEAEKFGINYYAGANIFVHPIVADFYKAQTRVFTDPNTMGIVGQMLWDLRTTWSAMALQSTGFLFRQLYTPIIQTWAAGGRIDLYASDMTRVLTHITSLKAQGRSLDGFDQMFDNTKAIYDGMTERQLWDRARREGFMEEIVPWLGASAEQSYYRPSAGLVESIKRQFRYGVDVLGHNGELGVAGTTSELMKSVGAGRRNFTDNAFHAVMAGNVLIDNVARFAALKALTSNTPYNRMIKGIQGNFRQNNMGYDAALSRLRNYFFMYDDPGVADEWMKHIRPYWMFMSRNTFSIWRMMVREPGKFMAYNRLFALYNNREEHTNEESLPYAAVPDWMRDRAPTYWVRRDENGTPVEAVALARTGFDPVAEGLSSVTGIADSVLQAFGLFPRADMPTRGVSDRIADLPWSESNTNRTLDELFADSYGYLQAPYAFVTGFDPNTGRQLRRSEAGTMMSNLLGVEVTPMFKFMAESTLPQARSLDRANPFGIFGTPAQFDDQGNVTDPGRPSWAGASRSPTAQDFRSWWQRTASVMGVTLYNVDVLEQMGYRQQEITFAVADGYKAISRKRQQILEIEPNSQEFNRELENLRMMEVLQASLVLDLENIYAWGAERGMDLPAAIRYQRSQGLQELRGLTPEEENQVLQRVYGDNLLGGPKPQGAWTDDN